MMVGVKTWTARDMVPLAAAWLEARYPGAKIVEEFVCGRAAQARIDLAAITEDGIIGVEIKADSDDGLRLAHQGYAFSAVCRKVYLFTAPGSAERCARHRPESWGDMRIVDTASGPFAAVLIEAKVSPFESAPAMLSLLWRDELARTAAGESIAIARSWSHAKIVDVMADVLPLPHVRVNVCAALGRRRWRTAFKRIGAQVLPPDSDDAGSEF